MNALRSAARALLILGFFLYFALRFAAGWAARKLSGRPRSERQEWFAANVLELFRSLGATFIKVGQIMSTRPDLLPPYLIVALERLQDDVGPFPYAQVEATLRSELGHPIEDLFAEFAPTPIASASVAQVHKARLHDGRVVAVKVRRPSIEELCAFDLTVMRLFATAMELIPSFRLLAPLESVSEFGRGIRMQLDFTREADNNRRFRRNFAGDPDVIFPELVEELCTRQVLVMIFIEGTRLLRWRETTADPKRLAAIGFRVMLKMIFDDGFVHADLHPGNLFVVNRGGQRPALVDGMGGASGHPPVALSAGGTQPIMAILDLGLVGEMESTQRFAFARYFAAWVQGDGRTMAQIMTRFSPSRRILDYEGFEAAIVEFVQRYHGKRLGEVQVSTVFFDMMGILRRYRVRANPTFTLVNIAIAVVEGIGKQLDPDVDLMAAALPFFARFDFSTSSMAQD